jgi:hypothetical protein
MPCPSHSFHFITRTILGEEYRSLSSSLCSFLHSPVTSSLLGPNILLSTIFLNIFSLRSSLSVSDQVSHPYKTTGRIIGFGREGGNLSPTLKYKFFLMVKITVNL